MNAKVIVMPKAAVLDPQGNAVRDAMRHLGMPEVRNVRIGKYMEIEIDGQNDELAGSCQGARHENAGHVGEDAVIFRFVPGKDLADARCKTRDHGIDLMFCGKRAEPI